MSLTGKWQGLNSDIARHVQKHSNETLNAYAAQHALVEEHVGIEQSILSGGYGNRQIFELIQNASDAIEAGGVPGTIEILLTEDALYCANEGAAIETDGVTAILMSHVSRKKGSQIGHFGVGLDL